MLTSNILPDSPIEVVTTCRKRDLSVFRITLEKIFDNIKIKSIHVIVPDEDYSVFNKSLDKAIHIIPEDNFIPEVTKQRMRSYPGPSFPRAAGWYFQQMLKLQFAYVNQSDDYYLIWDADTIPLRPMRFFDEDGRMLLTKSTEYHTEYFETYANMFQEPAEREFSFISQHIIIQKSVMREMLNKVRWWESSKSGWVWKIMESFPAQGNYMFSEYETYGHYVKKHYPERVRFIERSWLREGSDYTNGWVPSREQMEKLADKYDFVAFEKAHGSWLSFSAAALKKQVRRALKF